MIRIRSKKMQTAVKIGLIFCYFFIMALMFVLGRSHTVIIDNNSEPAGAYKAIDGCSVSFNGGKAIEMFKGDRDKILLRGQSHTVTISFFNGQEDVTGTIRIPLFEDAVLVSLPALSAGREAVSPFELYQREGE